MVRPLPPTKPRKINLENCIITTFQSFTKKIVYNVCTGEIYEIPLKYDTYLVVAFVTILACYFIHQLVKEEKKDDSG